MTNEERAIVVALARCAVCGNEVPSEALLHQMGRLAAVLDADNARHITDLIEWARSGRPRSPHKVIHSSPDATRAECPQAEASIAGAREPEPAHSL